MSTYTQVHMCVYTCAHIHTGYERNQFDLFLFVNHTHPSQVVTSRGADPLTLDLLVHLTIAIRIWLSCKNGMITKVMVPVDTATEKVVCGSS